MNNLFFDVATFMKACGQDFPSEPDPNISDLSKLYIKLIKEEYDEFCQAEEALDNAKQLDACFDMIWVIICFMNSRCWNCNAAWNEGAASNIRKIDRDTGKVIRREDGKILKPKDWKEPDFKKFV
jgi:predicted HAD superfamily Cof-like phosphohydrolase